MPKRKPKYRTPDTNRYSNGYWKIWLYAGLGITIILLLEKFNPLFK
tara:strand:- start:237 stop:374 length:138 start_codon:yes stop_codon:yes gene_type:complete